MVNTFIAVILFFASGVVHYLLIETGMMPRLLVDGFTLLGGFVIGVLLLTVFEGWYARWERWRGRIAMLLLLAGVGLGYSAVWGVLANSLFRIYLSFAGALLASFWFLFLATWCISKFAPSLEALIKGMDRPELKVEVVESFDCTIHPFVTFFVTSTVTIGLLLASLNWPPLRQILYLCQIPLLAFMGSLLATKLPLRIFGAMAGGVGGVIFSMSCTAGAMSIAGTHIAAFFGALVMACPFGFVAGRLSHLLAAFYRQVTKDLPSLSFEL